MRFERGGGLMRFERGIRLIVAIFFKPSFLLMGFENGGGRQRRERDIMERSNRKLPR